MPGTILLLIMGVAQLGLAFMVFHRIVPVTLEASKASAARTWAFGLALVLFGVSNVAQGLGYAVQGHAQLAGQLCLVLAAILWAERLHRSPIRGWDDAGRAKAARKREARG